MDLIGESALKFIVDNGSTDFIYTALPKIEEIIINGINVWFEVLKEAGHYEDTVDVSAVFPKDKTKKNQITVECFAVKTVTQGFNDNEMHMIYEDGTSNFKEFLVRGSTITINCEVKCKSTTRPSLGKLLDNVILGFQTDIGNYLSAVKITIPANAVQFPTRLTKEKNETKDVAPMWEATVTVNDISLQWQQILDVNGNILKNYKYYLDKLG